MTFPRFIRYPAHRLLLQTAVAAVAAALVFPSSRRLGGLLGFIAFALFTYILCADVRNALRRRRWLRSFGTDTVSLPFIENLPANVRANWQLHWHQPVAFGLNSIRPLAFLEDTATGALRPVVPFQLSDLDYATRLGLSTLRD